jgi:ABC-type nitrate/sulfonate/bicarbonate transport system substrate-binding protein
MHLTIKAGVFGITALLLAACGGAAAPASTAPSSAAAAASPASAAASSKPAAAASAAASAKPAASAAASAKPAASGGASAKPAASGAAAAKPAESAAAVDLPKPEVTAFKMGNNAHEADSYDSQFALEQGIYKKHGFTGDVTSTYFDGDGKGRQALLAGQIDVMTGSPSSAIIAQTTDTPILVVAMNINHPTDDLVSIGSVKNIGDLKGKKVAVSTFGGDSHASVLLALKALGLNLSDVTVVEIGGQSARIAALTSGAVAAAPIDSSIQDTMKQQGFNILTHLPDAPVTLARESVMVRKDWATKNPNAVLNIVGSVMEAQQQLVAQKDDPAVAASFQKWSGEKEVAQSQKELQAYAPLALRNMRWTQDAFDNLKQVMVIADPTLSNVDVTKAYDLQYLDKLHSLGFDKAVGVPGA